MQKCAICGEEFEEKYMVKRSPSPASPKWLCWDCYRHSQREANLYDIRQSNRRRKIEDNKRRK